MIPGPGLIMKNLFTCRYAKKRPKGEYYDVILFEDDGSVFVLSFITRQKSGWKE